MNPLFFGLNDNNIYIEDEISIDEGEGSYKFRVVRYRIKNKWYAKINGRISFTGLNGQALPPLYSGGIQNLRLSPIDSRVDVQAVLDDLNFATRDCSGAWTINQYNGLKVGENGGTHVAGVEYVFYYITSPPRSGTLCWTLTCEIAEPTSGT